MFNLPSITNLLRTCHHPPAPNLRDDDLGNLYWASANKATIITGNPGTGKTFYAAYQIVMWMLHHPDCCAVVLDASGALKKAIILRIMTLPEPARSSMLRRLKINVLCDKHYVKPQPEFSVDYGVSFEDQVNRVSNNLIALNPDLMERAILGGQGLDEIFKEIGRLLCITINENGDNFQITEAKRLLSDPDLLDWAVTKFGSRLPSVQAFVRNVLLPASKELSRTEIDKRTYALRGVLGVVDTPEARATLGYYKPAYTMKQIEEENQLLVVSGENLLNQERLLGYLMVQQDSLYMQHINKRLPDDPKNKKSLLIIDELPWLLQYPGSEERIAHIASRYRSRNVGLVVIVQNYAQLGELLQEAMWTFGNHVCFSMENWNDAMETAKQYFKYEPRMVKQPPRTRAQNPTTEPERGQYDQYAYFIQNMTSRECIVKRYIDESTRDPFIRHVRRTRDWPQLPSREDYLELHNRLARDGAVSVKSALEVVSARVKWNIPKRPKVKASSGRPPVK